MDLRIELGEFYFQLEGQEPGAPIVLQAGQPYEIVFANVGEIEHEVLIGREVVTVDGDPDGYETNLLQGVEIDIVGEGWKVEASGLNRDRARSRRDRDGPRHGPRRAVGRLGDRLLHSRTLRKRHEGPVRDRVTPRRA